MFFFFRRKKLGKFKKKKKSGFEFWRLKVANSYFPATISTNENGSFPCQQHGPIRSFEKLFSCNKFVQAASVTGRISPYQQMNKKREKFFAIFNSVKGYSLQQQSTTSGHSLTNFSVATTSSDHLTYSADLILSWTMNTLPQEYFMSTWDHYPSLWFLDQIQFIRSVKPPDALPALSEGSKYVEASRLTEEDIQRSKAAHCCQNNIYKCCSLLHWIFESILNRWKTLVKDKKKKNSSFFAGYWNLFSRITLSGTSLDGCDVFLHG